MQHFAMRVIVRMLLQTMCMAITIHSILGERECSNTPNCRCTWREKAGMRATITCKNITVTDLLNLQCHSNMSTLVITDSTFNDTPIQEGLTTTKAPVERIMFKQSSLQMFSWKWMPESLKTLSITSTTVKKFYEEDVKHSNRGIEQECQMDHLKVLKIMQIQEWRMTEIPRCIPPSVECLDIHSVNLEEAAYKNQQEWPRSLQYLHLTNNSISKISENFFARIGENLTTISIKHQLKITETKFLLYLPTSTLTSLKLVNIRITHIPNSNLESLRRQNILQDLAIDHTFLSRIPDKLPNSLLTLQLTNNKITNLDIYALAHLHHLKSLDLSRNSIETLPHGFPISLEELYVSHNNLVTVSDDAFTTLTNLRILYLSDNKLERMPLGIQNGIKDYKIDGNSITDIGLPMHYSFCSSCEMLHIDRNPWDCNENMVKFLVWNQDNRNNSAISAINGAAICKDGSPGLHDQTLNKVMGKVLMYEQLHCDYNITHLKCSNNGMDKMPLLAPELKDVKITNNEKIGSIPDTIFHGMTILRLKLENIGLHSIPKGLPKTLIYLNMGFNKITDITDEGRRTLQTLTALQYLDMQSNKLQTFSIITIQPLHKLQWLHLKGNPLECECDLWPLVNWVNKTISVMSAASRTKLEEGFFGQCSTPSLMKGTSIRSLSKYFTSEKLCLPPNCGWDDGSDIINCSYAMQEKLLNTNPTMQRVPEIPPNSYWKTLDVSSLRLKADAINLTHLTHLETVILYNNSMYYIPIERLPKSVKIIDISNNNISKLPPRESLQGHFYNLECIDMRNNNIRTVTEEGVGNFQYLLSLKLQGNPLICDCRMRPLVSWITANHDVPTKKQHDFKDLLCEMPDNLKGRKIAALTDSDYCPIIRISVVVGGLAGGVSLLVLIFCLSLGYYRKRGKIKEREAILKGFRDLLQQEAEFKNTDPETGIEDNSRIKYDAFLSYSPHDEDSEFAAMLSDELESKHSYKLCIHERDFLPGMGIADNIVECIGASKRIILVLSRHFVSSPWCQYEVQIALTELHQKRKSNLLIPILLEDLDQNIEGSVKTFLSLIKAIKIPYDKSHSSWEIFWKEVLAAMPEPQIQDDAV